MMRRAAQSRGTRRPVLERIRENVGNEEEDDEFRGDDANDGGDVEEQHDDEDDHEHFLRKRVDVAAGARHRSPSPKKSSRHPQRRAAAAPLRNAGPASSVVERARGRNEKHETKGDRADRERRGARTDGRAEFSDDDDDDDGKKRATKGKNRRRAVAGRPIVKPADTKRRASADRQHADDRLRGLRRSPPTQSRRLEPSHDAAQHHRSPHQHQHQQQQQQQQQRAHHLQAWVEPQKPQPVVPRLMAAPPPPPPPPAKLLGVGAYAHVTLQGKTAIKHVNYTYAWVQELCAACVLNGLEGLVEFDIARSVASLPAKQVHMKAYAGGSLREHYKKTRAYYRGRCATRLAATVFEQFGDIARGLAQVHAKFLVHADATSRNIFVGAPGATRGWTRFVARLGDLGITGASGHAHVSFTPLPYREPQVQSDAKHDIFTIGVVFLEVLGDQNLEPRMHEYEELQQFAYDACAANRFSARVAHFVARMLAADRRARPSAPEVAHFFEQLARQHAAEQLQQLGHSERDGGDNDEADGDGESSGGSGGSGSSAGDGDFVKDAAARERRNARAIALAADARHEAYRVVYRRKCAAAQADKDAQTAESVRALMRQGTTSEYYYTARVLRALAASVGRLDQWHDPLSECLGPLSVLIAAKERDYQRALRAHQSSVAAFSTAESRRKPKSQSSAAMPPPSTPPPPQPPPSLECWGAAAVYVIACNYGYEYFQRLHAIEWCVRESPDNDGEAGFNEALQHICNSYPVVAHILLTHLQP